MAVDKNKIIAEATRLVQRGALDKAIAAYRKILAADPKDVRILLKVGELHQRKGEAAPAAEAFGRVAETYADQGFFLKAIAVYKQIIRLDPGNARVSERLAALYQQLGLLTDAMVQLQRVAAAAEQAGDVARLGDVLRRMVELAPDDVASTVKLGELHARAGEGPLAVECLRRAAGQLKAQGRTDEYVRVAERLASMQPGDLSLVRELAHLHLARGDTKRALAKLQLSFKAEPGDVETLHLLAQAFRDLGQGAKVVSVYRELAVVHAEQGRPGEARATWKKVLELAPGDEEAEAALEEAPAQAAPAPPPPEAAPGARRAASWPAPGSPPVPEVPRSAPPAKAPPPALAPPLAGSPPPAAAPARPAAAPAALPTDPVERLLAEADVYAKYGLHDRALQHLGKVLELDPGSPGAHERARELHAAAGRQAQAAEAGAAAVRALRGRGEAERARRALERLRELAPDHPELAALSAGAGAPAEVSEEISLEPSGIEPLAIEPAPDVTDLESSDLLSLPGVTELDSSDLASVPDVTDLESPDLGSLPGGTELDSSDLASVPDATELEPPDVAPAPEVTDLEPAGLPDAEPASQEEEGLALEVGEPEPELEPELDGEVELEVEAPPAAPPPRAAALSRREAIPPAAPPPRAAPIARPSSASAAAAHPQAAPSAAPRPSSEPATAARAPFASATTARSQPTPASDPRPPPATAASARSRPAPSTAAPAATLPPPPARSAAARPPDARARPQPTPTSTARPEPAPTSPPPAAPAAITRPAPSGPGLAPVEEDLSDDLEVAQFFLEQGLVKEARDALRALAAAHPGHRGVRARLEALEREAAPPAAARALQHDLAREIEDDLGAVPVEEAFQYSVEDVFDQFKKGIEQTIRPEDSATHYDLGIAYREMGLLDDAVHEFETALRGADGRRAVDCLSMLGACRMARGEPREAAKVYRLALASPHLTAEASKALHFDLGDALEAAGDREAALQSFRTVSQLDAGYRRVADRLAALAGPALARKRSADPSKPE